MLFSIPLSNLLLKSVRKIFDFVHLLKKQVTTSTYIQRFEGCINSFNGDIFLYYINESDQEKAINRLGKAVDYSPNLFSEVLEYPISEFSEEQLRIYHLETLKNEIELNNISSTTKLFERLRRKRYELAKKQGVPAYIICNNETLLDLCKRLPINKTELLDVKGFGVAKAEKYGADFISIIKSF